MPQEVRQNLIPGNSAGTGIITVITADPAVIAAEEQAQQRNKRGKRAPQTPSK